MDKPVFDTVPVVLDLPTEVYDKLESIVLETDQTEDEVISGMIRQYRKSTRRKAKIHRPKGKRIKMRAKK